MAVLLMMIDAIPILAPSKSPFTQGRPALEGPIVRARLTGTFVATMAELPVVWNDGVDRVGTAYLHRIAMPSVAEVLFAECHIDESQTFLLSALAYQGGGPETVTAVLRDGALVGLSVNTHDYRRARQRGRR